MATNGSEYKTVARLSDLTIQQLKATTLSTEVLLFLPNEVLRDLCWINSKYRRYIILITDIPTKSDGNMVSGAICGYHALKREFFIWRVSNSCISGPTGECNVEELSPSKRNFVLHTTSYRDKLSIWTIADRGTIIPRSNPLDFKEQILLWA